VASWCREAASAASWCGEVASGASWCARIERGGLVRLRGFGRLPGYAAGRWLKGPGTGLARGAGASAKHSG